MKPNYPFLFQYGDSDNYAAVSENDAGKMTLVCLNSSNLGEIYKDNITAETLLRGIRKGNARILGQNPFNESKASTLKLDVSIDTSPLVAATKAAQKLEAALGRVKELLA